MANGYVPERYPRLRRLDSVRAGRPVTVFDDDLPAWARDAAGRRWSGRVTVGPDDSVTASDEDSMRAWLEEIGEAPPGWAALFIEENGL